MISLLQSTGNENDFAYYYACMLGRHFVKFNLSGSFYTILRQFTAKFSIMSSIGTGVRLFA